MRKVKISVLMRYYKCVCSKLHKARAAMNEPEISRLKQIKMKLLFLEQAIYKDYAKHEFTTLVNL